MNGPPETKAVVLISADIEWTATRSIMGQETVQASHQGAWFQHHLITPAGDHRVVFFHGGWGKIAAAASTQYVIDHCRPDLVMNLGTCGGFQGEIDKGAVILVEKTLVYDIHEQMGDPKEHIAHYTTDLDLSWIHEPYPFRVHRTLMVSGDRDISPDDVLTLRTQYGAVAGDWESAAVAWVCKRNAVRCLILRGVTDLVGAGGGEAYDGKIVVYERNTELILRELIGQLPTWINLSFSSTGHSDFNGG